MTSCAEPVFFNRITLYSRGAGAVARDDSGGSRIIERGFQGSRARERSENLLRDHAHLVSNQAYIRSLTRARNLLLMTQNTWQLRTP